MRQVINKVILASFTVGAFTLGFIPKPDYGHFPKPDKKHIQKIINSFEVADHFDEANKEINTQIKTYNWRVGKNYDLWGYRIG